jgi:hypothetical protein
MNDPSQPPPLSVPPGGAAPAGPSSPGSWWRGASGIAIIALLCLGAGVGIGIAVQGSGGEAHPTVADVRTVTVTRTAGAPTVPARLHTVRRTVTQTVTITASDERSKTVTSPTTYSGNGPKKIGALVLGPESVLRWHASGGHFTLENAPQAIDHLELKRSGTSGEAVAANGTYPGLEVIASGSWELTVSPK